jgi:hypothetical protein
MTWTILPGHTDVSPTSVLWSVVAVLGTFIAARYAGRAVTRLGHQLPSVEEDRVLQASRVVRYVVLMIGATAEVGSRVARRIQRACGADGAELALAWPPPAAPAIRAGAL